MSSSVPNVYSLITAEIRNKGFHVTDVERMGDWSRVTICSKRRAGSGYSGNSFWLTYLSGEWHLGTWGGLLYRLPDKKRIVELCVEWLSSEPEKTAPDCDEELKNRFELIDISDEEFDAMAGKTFH